MFRIGNLIKRYAGVFFVLFLFLQIFNMLEIIYK